MLMATCECLKPWAHHTILIFLLVLLGYDVTHYHLLEFLEQAFPRTSLCAYLRRIPGEHRFKCLVLLRTWATSRGS